MAYFNCLSYIEDALYWFHRKIFTHFDHKEVYIFLISLQQIDWIVTLHNQDLIVFAGEKLCKFSVLDGCVLELKGSVKHAEDGRNFGPPHWDLHISEHLLQGLLILNFERFHAWIAEKLFRLIILFEGLLLQIFLYFCYAIQMMGKLIPLADLIIIFFIPFSQFLQHIKDRSKAFARVFFFMVVCEA